ncbi:MAG: alanine/glycine:cation symporter family protein [Eubacteriaceae bacterium]|nr:alanine/glycine:cation symporter family protein [Eubacteriaceae bacterium]
MEFINSIINAVSGVLYEPWCVPLILLAGGIYLTVRSKFIQVRLFREAFKVILEKPSTENGISSFGALMVSTASRVGTGNIIGVATAICAGGAGAVFWMWITAIIGGASAFVESTLAQIYKKRNNDGTSYGGPAFYMRDALKQRWLGVIFSVLIILTYAVGYNMLAAYNLQDTFSAFDFYSKTTAVVIGLILAVLFGIIVIGGAKRLIKVTEVMVPVMGVLYVIVAIFVLIMNAKQLPGMFAMIFESAFDFKAIFGGFAGSCIMNGIKRGLYSNEAGMGSAPNAAATADVSHPAKQGLVQMLSVFIDTLLICTATAFMCLSSGTEFNPDMGGASYVQSSMAANLGSIGPVFLCVAMSLFAFTTLIGNYSYCEGCLRFILNREVSRNGILVFRVLATVLVFIGAIASAGTVWNLADMTQGLMVIVNVPVIIILAKPAMKCLDDYCRQKKEGKNPVFIAKNAGIDADLDYWK